jgi:uncharacterized membrane protein YeaQ/YmgE (transglycosylase-associated protein family)
MIWALFIGLIVGIVARFFMPGRDPGGVILTCLLGIVGAAFAHWAGSAVGIYRPGEPVGFISAVIGAMMVLFIFRLIFGSK